MIDICVMPAASQYYLEPAGENAARFIPYFLYEDDPRPAAEQFNSNYIGGWSPFEGFVVHPDGSIQYPEDPVLPVLVWWKFRDEVIRIHVGSWVSITQPDGSVQISRMD